MTDGILFVGGSHLASCHALIRNICAKRNRNHDFFVTAGGSVARWLSLGNQWTMIENRTLKGFRDPRLSIADHCDLSKYSKVVAVGHYIQPSRVFCDPYFDWSQPLDRGFVKEVSEWSFTNTIHPPFRRTFMNLVVSAIRKTIEPKTPVIFIADPMVREGSHLENNNIYATEVPTFVKHIYYETFSKWCIKQKIIPVIQPQHTFCSESFLTLPEYAASPIDDWHMNAEFWMQCFNAGENLNTIF